MTAVATKLVTADELLAMGDIGRCELVYGELIMMSPAGGRHGMIALQLGAFLRDFVYAHRLGYVFGAETGFLVQRDPDLVRAPDVSFVRKDHLPDGPPDGFVEGVPALAVEVASPHDVQQEVAAKKNMWLAHGTESVWIVDPPKLTITVHRVGQKPRVFGVADTLIDEPLLPGFTLTNHRVFQPL